MNESLKEIKLGAPAEVRVKDCPNLQTLSVQSSNRLTNLILQGDLGNKGAIERACDFLGVKESIDTTPFIDIKSKEDTIEELTKDQISTLAEYTDKITEDSVVEGNVHASVAYAQDIDTLEERFPDLHIITDALGIKFVDPEVERVLLASTNPKIDTDEDGVITKEEAENVTSLPSFQDNTKIESFEELRLFKNYKTIPAYSFIGSSIKHISLENIERLSDYTFSETPLDGDVNMPNLMEWIHAFHGAAGTFYRTKITSVSNLGNITSIPNGSYDGWPHTGIFSQCKELKSVVLPETLTFIGMHAFNNCSALESINLEKVKEIGIFAFEGCSSLRSIDLSSVETLCLGAFNQCNNLSGILRMPNLKNVRDVDRNYNAGIFNNTNITAVLDIGTITKIPNPSTLAWVANGMFSNCTNLKIAVLPQTINFIGFHTFINDTSLSTVVCKSLSVPTLYNEDYWGIRDAFTGCPLSNGIFVPSSSVDAYKAADGWSLYASKIFAIGGSEYQAAAQAAADEEGVDVSGMDLSDENIFEYIYTHLPEQS